MPFFIIKNLILYLYKRKEEKDMDFLEMMFCSHNEAIEELIKEKRAKGEIKLTEEEIYSLDLLSSEIKMIEEELSE